ncbi:MAG: hypothetical protein P8O72_03560 [Flavobacteriaceae bacterium]|jgi:hypothetical protein|nr:hypothetical protein [Flavobacteriaceae bacterium]
MSKRILFFEFPKGISSVFIDGKRYNRKSFLKAQQLERRRNSNTGKFQIKTKVGAEEY